MKLSKIFNLWTFLVFAGFFSGCGYTFQHVQNPLLESHGIRRIYVAPLRNDTLKPGVENLVYNELVRIIAAHRRVKLVSRGEDSDATLHGNVNSATYNRGSATTANSLFPTNEKFNWIPQVSKSIVVATEYSANLGATFVLRLREKEEGNAKTIWSSSFSRAKNFPGNNQVGNFGNTSSLINESEFDRALTDMARNMMADVHESMLAMF